MKELKCPVCKEWYSGEIKSCPHCGHEQQSTGLTEQEQRQDGEVNSLPFIKIPKKDSPAKKLWKYPVLWAQVVFFSIISMIAAMAAGTVH